MERKTLKFKFTKNENLFKKEFYEERIIFGLENIDCFGLKFMKKCKNYLKELALV